MVTAKRYEEKMKLYIMCLLAIGFCINCGCAYNKYDCIYNDMYYSEGSVMVQDGIKMKSVRGKWIEVEKQ